MKNYKKSLIALVVAGVFSCSQLSNAATVTEIQSNSTLLIGSSAADNPIRVFMSDLPPEAYIQVGADNINIMQALPVLMGNTGIEVSASTRQVSGNHYEITNMILVQLPNRSNLDSDQIGAMMLGSIFNGLVLASRAGSSGVLLPTPTQSVMAATALANGNHVSYSTYSFDIPIFDSNGNFITIMASDTLAEVFTLKD